MKVLVTGCAGWLGRNLIPALEAAGHEVRGVDVVGTERPGDVVRDLCEEGVLTDVMEGVEVVVHTAAIHPWKPYRDTQYLDNNIKPTYHVLKTAVAKGVRRVVYTSSIAAVGYGWAVEELPLVEWTPARPDDLYGATKWFGEVFCESFSRRHDLETVCLRPPGFMPRPPLELGRLLLGAFSHVIDVVAAHVAAVAAPMPTRHEAFWCTNALPYTPADAPALRTDPASVVERYWPGVPAWFEARGQRVVPVPVLYDLSRAREILGWTPQYTFDAWWEEYAHEL
jgi:UDP-glucose 4-epimerase